jgi:hypothetical protein
LGSLKGRKSELVLKILIEAGAKVHPSGGVLRGNGEFFSVRLPVLGL